MEGVSSRSVSERTSSCFFFACVSSVVSSIMRLASGIFSCLSCFTRASAETSKSSSTLSKREISHKSEEKTPSSQVFQATAQRDIDFLPQDVRDAWIQTQKNMQELENLQRKRKAEQQENIHFKDQCDQIEQTFKGVETAYDAWEAVIKKIEDDLNKESDFKNIPYTFSRGLHFSEFKNFFDLCLKTAKSALAIADSSGCGINKDMQRQLLDSISGNMDSLKKRVLSHLQLTKKILDRNLPENPEKRQEYLVTYCRGASKVLEEARQLASKCGNHALSKELESAIQEMDSSKSGLLNSE